MIYMDGYNRSEIGFATVIFGIVFYMYQMIELGYFQCWDWIFTTLFFAIAFYIIKYCYLWINANDIFGSNNTNSLNTKTPNPIQNIQKNFISTLIQIK